MKILAFYLPQFHEIPENNDWWGKGFTEWTNVRKAKPLFKGHNQPRYPLDDYYYSLTDVKTIRWQAELAKTNKIDGFCFYHYWFNEKLLLEKPVELLRLNQNIDIDYCFSWANESWVRSWDGQGKEILIEQKYGNEELWLKHFHYFLPYFTDNRYIKKNNKPVLIIYRTNNIPNFSLMILFWDKLAKENGFEGIFVIESLTAFQSKKQSKLTDAVLHFEPSYTKSINTSLAYKLIKKIIKNIYPKVIFDSYDYIWKQIINRKTQPNETIYPGAFVDWDNSPRRNQGAHVMFNTSVTKFKKYFTIQYAKAIEKYKADFLFVNAWNEWAEGTYLEPDKKNKYNYLISIRETVEEYGK